MADKKKAAPVRRKRGRQILLIGVALVITITTITMVQTRPASQTMQSSKVQLPAWLDQHPDDVRAAYAYAAEHQDVLKYMACYCGCENHGHVNNATCYIKDTGSDGKREWDSHAAT